jgi:hypothetical protein
MLKIIDTQEKFSDFLTRYKESECVMFPVLSNRNQHIILNSICLLFVRLLNPLQDYVLCFEHNEAQHLPISILSQLDSDKVKYVIDKKWISHKLQLSKMIDLSLIHWMRILKPIEIPETSSTAHALIYANFRNFKFVNRAIPILKYYQSIEQLFSSLTNDISDAQTMVDSTVLPYFNDIMSENLRKIESNGLHINTEEAKQHWSETNISQNIVNDCIYTSYNPFTITGRPSNRFGGINFAALNKSDGTRNIFTSRYGDDGVLVEFDYDACHLRLIANVVGYTFPPGSVHKHLATFYGTDYEGSKKLSFTYLYGGVPKAIALIIPYFKAVNDYIEKIWKEFSDTNSLRTNIYTRQITKEMLPDISKTTLFNYLIQILETESNMLIAQKVLQATENKKTKLVLYTYDSFLFDMHKDEMQFTKDLVSIFESDGKFPVKVKIGSTYGSMKTVKDIQ